MERRLDAAHPDDGARRGTAIPGSGPLRVVIADDHAVYRQGLAKLLIASGIDVVAEAADGRQAIELVEEHAPDVAVIDLNMPGLSGAAVTRRLIERNPASRVLVVSVSAQEEDVTEAILAGANGYALKDAPVEEVVAGIRAAAAGESLISARVAAMLLRKIRKRGTPKPEELLSPLSARELEVLQLVADGKANHEIAEALVIDESTVRNHIASILMKLRADDRVQAAVRAVRAPML
jgi:DNA-binding NarL/FixJ family response regulator